MKAIYLRRYTYILIPVFCGPFFYWIFPCTYYNLGKEKKAVTICKYNCIYQTFCITNDPIVISVETQSEEMLVGNMRSHRKLICRFKNLGGVWGFFCFFYTSVYDFRKFLATMVVDSLHKCISATGNTKYWQELLPTPVPGGKERLLSPCMSSPSSIHNSIQPKYNQSTCSNIHNPIFDKLKLKTQAIFFLILKHIKI